jgi:hypothetical protein
MSGRRPARFHLGDILTLLLVGTIVLAMTHSAHAQSRAHEPVHPRGVPVTMGSDWLVNLDAATLTLSPLNHRLLNEQRMLVLTLQVRNITSVTRLFPLHRLHLLDGSGLPQRDTWCGSSAQPLELTREIAPGGVQTGDVCWLVGAATIEDVSDLLLHLDAPAADQHQAVFVAVSPVADAVARAVRTIAPTALPIVATALDAGAPPAASVSAANWVGLAAPGANPIALSPTPTLRAPCAGAYSAYADSRGSYLATACPVASNSTEGSAAALRTPGVSPSALYPSANQPLGSPSAGFGIMQTNSGAPTPGPTPTNGGFSQSAITVNSNGERR